MHTPVACCPRRPSADSAAIWAVWKRPKGGTPGEGSKEINPVQGERERERCIYIYIYICVHSCTRTPGFAALRDWCRSPKRHMAFRVRACQALRLQRMRATRRSVFLRCLLGLEAVCKRTPPCVHLCGGPRVRGCSGGRKGRVSGRRDDYVHLMQFNS